MTNEIKTSNFSHGKLKYVKGSASEPKSGDNRVIINIVDKSGEWEEDLSKKISAKWPKVKESYRGWFRGQVKFNLGEIQTVQIQSDTVVVNCLAKQNGKVDLVSLTKCLTSLGKEVELTKANLHMDSLNEDWDKVQEIITKAILSKGLSLNVYGNIEVK